MTADGWVLEVAIPFTTIRFDNPTAPVMGIALLRSIRRKNETVFWPHIGQEYRGGIRQVSRYATLTGLHDLRTARHIELKPFVIAGSARTEGTTEWQSSSDVGLDAPLPVELGRPPAREGGDRLLHRAGSDCEALRVPPGGYRVTANDPGSSRTGMRAASWLRPPLRVEIRPLPGGAHRIVATGAVTYGAPHCLQMYSKTSR